MVRANAGANEEIQKLTINQNVFGLMDKWFQTGIIIIIITRFIYLFFLKQQWNGKMVVNLIKPMISKIGSVVIFFFAQYCPEDIFKNNFLSLLLTFIFTCLNTTEKISKF